MTESRYPPYAKCTLLVPTPTAKQQSLHHLMLVVTDPVNIPPPSVIIVPLNTHYAGCDETCLLNEGDHPFINRKAFSKIKKLPYDYDGTPIN